ncbi:uncharacterized protein LOC103959800 isoform X2 [Pyrus x bretschneideri]|uniref:uncharacterized protein LOC103959800 isoform X2 n=1 Tax=Pyrus x bretschneideri TaxID=225117 RepID=UPI00202EC50D|nr:uncharacterized protein LOC103959800 isoform X2 [Pyrus x bretschneideri]
MEGDVDCCIEPDESLPLPHAQFDGGATAVALNCSLNLDRVGEVLLSSNSDGLFWKSLEPFDNVLTNQFKLCTGLSTVEAENVDEVVIVDADMIIRKQIVP